MVGIWARNSYVVLYVVDSVVDGLEELTLNTTAVTRSDLTRMPRFIDHTSYYTGLQKRFSVSGGYHSESNKPPKICPPSCNRKPKPLSQESKKSPRSKPPPPSPPPSPPPPELPPQGSSSLPQTSSS